MNKKISVIVTCYNLELYISRAIHSCLNQTLSDRHYEIVIVDDCSTDRSWDHIGMFENYDDVIKTIRCPENKGPAAASNIGIKEASGKYIIRVDGDDFINRNLLFVMSEVLEHNDDIGFVYCDYVVIEKDKPRRLEINTLEKLLDHGAGVMFRKSYLESIGLYDEKYRNCEDYELILRYMKNFNGYHLRLPYYRYFKRNGLSSMVKEREDLKRKIVRKDNG